MGRVRAAFGAHPWVEAAAFVVLLMVYIWCVEPGASAGTRLLGTLGLTAIPVGSQLLRREHARDLGLRLDNLTRSGRDVMLATVLGSLALITLGTAAGWRFEMGGERALMPVGYSFWGFSQQYALQSFVHRRLRGSGAMSRRAPLISALCFGLVHLPNPALVLATSAMGYVWCRLYQREPNLFTLALSHAWLATMMAVQVPDDLHHSMKVGPGWFDGP